MMATVMVSDYDVADLSPLDMAALELPPMPEPASPLPDPKHAARQVARWQLQSIDSQ